MIIDWKPLSEQELKYLQIMSLHNSTSSKLLRLGESICPDESQIIAGTTKEISLTPLGGTPPYTINWKIDGEIVNTWNNIQQGTIHTFNWSFNESSGSHTYSVEVLDSCLTDTVSDSTSCTINIVQETSPIPTSSPTPSPASTTSPSPPPSCQNCNLNENVCILDRCIPKNYLIYGGIGLVTLLMIAR